MHSLSAEQGFHTAQTVKASTTEQPSLDDSIISKGVKGIRAGFNQFFPLCLMRLLAVTPGMTCKKQEFTWLRRSWDTLQKQHDLCLALPQSHKDRTGLLEVSCPNPCTEQGQLSFKYLQGLESTTSLEPCPGV